MRRLRRLSRVRSSECGEMDSVMEMRSFGERRAFDVLLEAQRAWNNMDRFRRERDRNKRYTYGRQWDDVIKVDGKEMREEDYIRSQGNVPLKNNVIGKMKRTVLGVWHNQNKEPTCVARDRDEQRLGETMSTVLQCNMQLNKRNELDARMMEEFLIGGLAVYKKWCGWRRDQYDCWTDPVPINCFFVDSNMRDPRGWDCSLVGEIHDVGFGTLVSEFAQSASDYARLSRIYASARDGRLLADYASRFGESRLQNFDFMLTNEPSRCRVIEVWRKETKPRYRCHDFNSGELYKIETDEYEELVAAENRERLRQGAMAGMEREEIPLVEAEWFVDEYWYFYYLSPFGDILREGETPYNHKEHPYVFKCYPFIDGEIHSFVNDIVDQQRYINRLITLYDWIMRSSAKGLLLFPEDCLPKNMSLDDIADEWARFNGVIVVRKGATNLPQQVASNCTNIGVTELLNIQLKLIEDISGAQGALQGKPGNSSMSGTLYAQQAQNATTSLIDLLESFSSFIIDGAKKDVKNIQQFYDSERVMSIAGRTAVYDPSVLGNADFDLAITESAMTPAHRQEANELLMEIWRNGQITLKQMLENGSFPFADDLIQSLDSQQEQMEQGQTPDGLQPELQRQVQQGADMDAVNRAYGMLTGK